jgi:hypothetical protein
MRFLLESKPRLDSIRVSIKFAWIPTRTDDDYIVWLEFYTLTEKYTYWVTNGVEVLRWGAWSKKTY